MKPGWTEVALGELLELDLDAVVVDPSENYEMVGVLSYGRGLFHKPPVAGSDTSYKTFYRLRRDQIVLSQLFGWEGAIAPVIQEFEGKYVSSQFPTFRTKPNVDFGFAKWLLRSPMVWEQLKSSAKGMGDRRRTLSPEIFFAVLSTLPPLAEQQRIVAHLDAIEQRLNRVQKLREESERESMAALRSAFHQIEATAEWVEIGEVAPLVRREVTIEAESVYTEFGIKSFYKGIFLRRSMKGEAYEWQKLFRVKEGDVVFSNIMAWEKAIGLASTEHEGWVGNHRMLVCEPIRERVLPSWLYFYFTTPEGFAEIEKASPGTAARNKTLKARSLERIRVPIPSMAAQEHFDHLFKLIESISTETHSFEPDYDSLIPSLLESIFN